MTIAVAEDLQIRAHVAAREVLARVLTDTTSTTRTTDLDAVASVEPGLWPDRDTCDVAHAIRSLCADCRPVDVASVFEEVQRLHLPVRASIIAEISSAARDTIVADIGARIRILQEWYSWQRRQGAATVLSDPSADGQEVRDVLGDLGLPPLAWEKPAPLDAATVPLWPRDVFPPDIEAFVDALSVSTETPVELASMLCLSVLATAAQGKYRVRIAPDYFQPVNLWTCVVSPPATRKTAVQVAVVAPLVEWQRSERERLEPEVKRIASERKTLEGRIETLRKQAAKTDGANLAAAIREIAVLEGGLQDIPTLPRLFTDDCTPEHLATLMAQNDGRLALVSDEGGGLFGLMAGRYTRNGAPNLNVYLQSHEGAAHVVDRGSREPVYLERPALSIGITIQPDVVQSLRATAEFRGRGLLGRFLWCLPESTVGRRTLDAPPMPDSVRAAYHDVVRTLLDHLWNQGDDGNPCAHQLRLSHDAHAAHKAFALAVESGLAEGGTFTAIPDWAGKLPAAVARIAAVLHVTRYAHGQPWAHEICGDDMRAALALGDVLCKHALLAFDTMGADGAMDGARTLLRWIRREGRGEFSRRDAQHALQCRFPRAADLAGPLEILYEHGYVRQRPRPTGAGRPSAVYDVHPSILEGRG